MNLERPLSPNQRGLLVAGALASLILAPFLVKFGTVRWMENRRLQTPSSYVFPSRELADLDRLLQARFAVVPDNDFGLGRIGPRHEIFKPVGATEQKAIEALRRRKQEVVFYVAGRNYLERKPTAGAYKAFLQGPVFMTQKPPLKVKATQTFERTQSGSKWFHQPTFQTEKRPIDLPTEAQLRESLGVMLISNSRIDHTATPDGKTLRAGAWQVAAVPVRATDQACVKCHSYFSRSKGQIAPRMGEPLGIALYAFRSTSGQSTKTTSVKLPPAAPPLKLRR